MRVRSRSLLQLAGQSRLGGQFVFGGLQRALQLRCTVATSLTDSAIMRVSSWKRVKRSISSGSKACAAALAASMRD
jgi:hypothetical protein